jgi:hypothetical protein
MRFIRAFLHHLLIQNAMFAARTTNALAGPSTRQVIARGFASTAGLDKEKLVVLGSGWAGYNVARSVTIDCLQACNLLT